MSFPISKEVQAPFVFFIPSLAGGGAERVMLRLLSGLRSSHPVELVVIEPVFDYPLIPGVTCHVLGTEGGPLGQAFRLSRLLDKLRPRAVLSFLPAANVLAVLGSRLMKSPRPKVVISERISVTSRTGLKKLLHRVVVTGVYPLSDKIIAVTPQVQDELKALGVSAAKLRVIPNPIETEVLQDAAGKPTQEGHTSHLNPFIFALGRLHPTKGFDLLIEAFSKLALRPQLEQWQLIIAGVGPEHKNLTQQVFQLRLSDRIKIIPFLTNPFPMMSAADVFVMPSRSEGFPNALLEAMALGKACVAFDCPGGPRFVGGNAVELVPPGDTAALAAKMEELMLEGSARKNLGALAAEHSKRYQLASIAAQYLTELSFV